MHTRHKPEDYAVDALDKVQIAALKKADDVSFHHNNGKSYIVATKRKARTARDPFADDVRVQIMCGWRLDNYEGWPSGAQQSLSADEFKAFDMIHSPDRAEWQTIASLLKPGDKLALRWLRGNSTEVLRDAKMVTDSLTIAVDRDGAKKPLVFLVAQLTTDEHSSARIVRKG